MLIERRLSPTSLNGSECPPILRLKPPLELPRHARLVIVAKSNVLGDSHAPRVLAISRIASMTILSLDGGSGKPPIPLRLRQSGPLPCPPSHCLPALRHSNKPCSTRLNTRGSKTSEKALESTKPSPAPSNSMALLRTFASSRGTISTSTATATMGCPRVSANGSFITSCSISETTMALCMIRLPKSTSARNSGTASFENTSRRSIHPQMPVLLRSEIDETWSRFWDTPALNSKPPKGKELVLLVLALGARVSCVRGKSEASELENWAAYFAERADLCSTFMPVPSLKATHFMLLKASMLPPLYWS